MKTIIGITTSLWSTKPEAFGDPARTFDHGKQAYSLAVQASGGLPFFLPTQDPACAAEVVACLDGLLLSGGNDLDPSLYAQENRFPASVIHPARDAWELALVAAARACRIPLFGICRGHQLLNVAFGGTLHQDLSLRPGTHDHRARGETEPSFHDVTLEEDSHLAALLGMTHLRVTSTHHQLVDRVADTLRVAARASDGAVEALERVTEAEWVVCVQWHPELEPDSPHARALLAAFVGRAAQQKSG